MNNIENWQLQEGPGIPLTAGCVPRIEKWLMTKPAPDGINHPAQLVCWGKNCGATDGKSHSAECFAEHKATVSGASAKSDADQTDDINHPAHYASGKVECIDAIEAALTPEEYRGYLKGNIIKYTWRERTKEGDKAMGKARWYLNRMLDGAK